MEFVESTTHRGDVAEMLAAAELMRRGYRVSRPLSNGAPYDLVVDDGVKLHRVQVKRAVVGDGCIRARLCTSKYHRGRALLTYAGQVDAVIVVDCESGRFYVFVGDDLANPEMWLRLAPAKNGQSRKTRAAADYDLGRAFP